MIKKSEYNFTKFGNFNARTSEAVWTITSNNTIGLSASWCDENGVSKFSYAVLFYDSKANSIGIKLTSNKTETSKFSLSRREMSSGVNIIAHSFFNKNNIDSNKYARKKYVPKKLSLRHDVGIDELGSLYVIDLDNPKE